MQTNHCFRHRYSKAIRSFFVSKIMVLQKNFLHRVNMQTQTANCSKTSRFTIGFEGFDSSEGMYFLWFREELECTFDVRLRQRSRRWFWSDFGSSKLTFCRLKVGWHGRCFGGWFSACLSIGGRSVEPPPPPHQKSLVGGPLKSLIRVCCAIFGHLAARQLNVRVNCTS